MTKYIRYPGPGEFRGEGKWYSLEELTAQSRDTWKDEDWETYRRTGFLPTFEGDGPPSDDDEGGEDGSNSGEHLQSDRAQRLPEVRGAPG